MKKRQTILFSVLLLGLAACQRSEISAREAGQLFVDELVYNSRTAEFEQQFSGGNDLKTALKKTRESILNNFLSDYSSPTVQLSEEKKKDLLDIFTTQLEKHTKFNTLIKGEENGNEKTVLIQIFGLDYEAALQEGTQEIIDTIVQDKALMNDNKKLESLIYQTFKDTLEKMTMVKTPVETSLKVAKSGRSWYILSGQESEIQNIYVNFLTGQKDGQMLSQKVDRFMAKIGEEVAKKLAEENKKSNE